MSAPMDQRTRLATLGFGDWITRVDELREEFQTAQPFPLLVIDDFLDDELARGLLDEFPSPDAMPKSRDYLFGDKRELSSVPDQGPASRRFFDLLMGDEFASLISTLTGRDLFVDPAFHGGGLHQSGDGGYLDTHVDFNMHPLHEGWLRSLNILLYLNEDWKDSYDGRLLVRSAPDDTPKAIEPLFNRGVIMVTNDSTFHGFDKMTLPAGVTRKSIATYAYEIVDPASHPARTTGWVPENAGIFKRTLAANYDRLVRVKGRWLGSATAKNR